MSVWVDDPTDLDLEVIYSVETNFLALSDLPSLLSSLESLKRFVSGIKMLAEVPLGQIVAVLTPTCTLQSIMCLFHSIYIPIAYPLTFAPCNYK